MADALNHLDDSQLAVATRRAKRDEDRARAVFIAHLVEVSQRRLHLALGYRSLTNYLEVGLGMSQNAAGLRTRVVHVVARFPRVLDMLAEGTLTQSSVAALARELYDKPEEADALLDAAAGKSKREVAELVADRAPRPDVAASVRRAPEPTPSAAPDLFAAPAGPKAERKSRPAPRQRAKHPAAPRPLGAGRFVITFTASARLRGKLEQLEALLSHRVARGDLAAVVEHAVDAAIAVVEKERFGVGRRSPRKPKRRSRHIPAAVRRQVFDRDEGRCTYIGADGRRCDARHHLQLDHIEPYALGGEHSVDNLRLLCRAHNQLIAVQQLGEPRVGPKRRAG